MTALRYSLITDGSSDIALIAALDWLLSQHLGNIVVESTWVDLRKLTKSPRNLPDRIVAALDLFPCDLLFVHRDAEGLEHALRVQEIARAASAVAATRLTPPIIPVVPIRMQEAWLLFDEAAIRLASGNPNGKVSLSLPHPSRVEQLTDPKDVLYNLLRQASQLHGVRLKRLDVRSYVYRVVQFIGDFSPLRSLSAFQALEADLVRVIRQQGW